MRRIGVLVVLGLALVGCTKTVLPVLPSLPVKDADFAAALAAPPSNGFIGTTPTLQGQVKAWKATKAQPVSVEWPQVNVVGEIQTTGAYSAKLLETPTKNDAIPLVKYVRQLNILEKYNCSVDSLVSTPATAQVVSLNLVTANPEYLGAQTLRPQFSPLPPPLPFATLDPTITYQNASEKIFFVDADASVRGELSCTSIYLEGSRYHLFVNMTLNKGWNTATLLYGDERTIGGERVQDMLFKGGVTRLTAQP